MKKILPPPMPSKPARPGRKNLAFALRFIDRMMQSRLPNEELRIGMQKMVDEGTIDLLYSICQLANSMVQAGALQPPKRGETKKAEAGLILVPKR